MDTSMLADWTADARARTLELVADLTDEQLRVPLLPTINPLLWEIGHVAWFQETWVLRHGAGDRPLAAGMDELYDSSAVAHDSRWTLPLPVRRKIESYLTEVRDRVIERLSRPGLTEREANLALLAIFHEDMHAEALLYTRQTLGYPLPRSRRAQPAPAGSESPTLDGDVAVPGGTFVLGARRDGGFVFDNEQWEHPVELPAFHIARRPVTEQELACFVEDGGYRRRELWCPPGWAWREEAGAERPVYFERRDGAWLRRHFDRAVPLASGRPAVHVNWYEASAFCRWAGRRLPSEAEWEAAAAGEPRSSGKRRFPWGERAPDASLANLDAGQLDTVDVARLEGGDSAHGCRQMIGNVWEWTASAFTPYPGFAPGAYEEYSAPWFGTHKVLRGGAWPTRSRLIRATWRNYYTPDRRDVFAGFRTCRLRDP